MQRLEPHVFVDVSNREKSVFVDEKAFGIAATKRRPDRAKQDLRSPSLNLTMTKAPRTGVDASQCGIQVATRTTCLRQRPRWQRLAGVSLGAPCRLSQHGAHRAFLESGVSVTRRRA